MLPRILALGLLVVMSLVLVPTTGSSSRAVDASAASLSWDPADEFSSSSNPSGAWSYGWSVSRGAPFNLFTNKYPFFGTDAWDSGSYVATTGIFHN